MAIKSNAPRKDEWLKKYVRDKKRFERDRLMAHTSNDLLDEISSNIILTALSETAEEILDLKSKIFPTSDVEPEDDEDFMYSFDERVTLANQNLGYSVHTDTKIRAKTKEVYGTDTDSLFMALFEQKIYKKVPFLRGIDEESKEADIQMKRLLNFIWAGLHSIKNSNPKKRR